MKASVPSRRFRTLAVAAAAAADDKKGEDIVLLNAHALTTLADYILIVSVHSPAHLSGVQDHIEKVLKTKGVYASHRDGRTSGLWRVLDYGGLIVHLMTPQTRGLYGLEKIFDGAKTVAWDGK